MIFVKSLLAVLSNEIGWYAFGMLYLGLFGFGMMTHSDSLNQSGQVPLSKVQLKRVARPSHAPLIHRAFFKIRYVTQLGLGAETSDVSMMALRAS